MLVKIESRFAVRIKGEWKEQGGGEQFVNLATLPTKELNALMQRMTSSDGLAQSIYHIKGETDRILYVKIFAPIENQGWVSFRQCIAEYDYDLKTTVWNQQPQHTNSFKIVETQNGQTQESYFPYPDKISPELEETEA